MSTGKVMSNSAFCLIRENHEVSLEVGCVLTTDHKRILKMSKEGTGAIYIFFNKLETTSKRFLAAYYQKFNSLLSTKVQFDNEKTYLWILKKEKKKSFFRK